MHILDKRMYPWIWAAKNGDLDFLKRLHENKTDGYIFSKCTTDVMNWAANNGRIDIVKYLYENRKF
jgi:ankyrin repeat protein